MPGFGDDILDRTPLLIVQVKHKKEIDYDDVDGVNQLVNWKPREGEKVRFKVLFSSAESFTEACKRIAEANDVILICGAEAGTVHALMQHRIADQFGPQKIVPHKKKRKRI